jgi:hypothetical protein
MDTIAYREELKRLGMDKDLADLIAHAPERLGGGYVTRDYLDAKLAKLESRIDGVEHKISGVEIKIDGLKISIDGLKDSLFLRLARLMFLMGGAYTAILFWALKYYKP